MAERLLIVEDEGTLSDSLKRVLSREGYEVDTVASAEEALQKLGGEIYDLIITDIILPAMDGIELLRAVRELAQEQIVIVMTAYASLDTAIGALKAGAFDYILKPIIHEEIKQVVKNALMQKTLRAENALLKKQIWEDHDFGTIVGNSAALRSILEEVKKIANTKSNVLLLGETGTGKELFARVIHHNSERKDMPFVPINCSAIPENLMESELFGHLKGAFTGALASKKGLFEEADRGTVFLDEIGDLGLPLQAKLLRVIDDLEIRPIGGVQSKKVDIRFIAATNRDITRAVKEGTFREDLYYRINVITLKLPPLRELGDDIKMLAQYYLEKYANDIRKTVKHIDGTAMSLLLNYSWPGNVRELKNIIERAVLITDSNTIFPEHLNEGILASEPFTNEALGKALSISDYTREFILRHQQNNTEQKIADMLGITRKALWEKRKKLGISRK